MKKKKAINVKHVNLGGFFSCQVFDQSLQIHFEE
jgi:hypothetical protein